MLSFTVVCEFLIQTQTHKGSLDINYFYYFDTVAPRDSESEIEMEPQTQLLHGIVVSATCDRDGTRLFAIIGVACKSTVNTRPPCDDNKQRLWFYVCGFVVVWFTFNGLCARRKHNRFGKPILLVAGAADLGWVVEMREV